MGSRYEDSKDREIGEFPRSASFSWPEKEGIEIDPEALVIHECFKALMSLYNPKDRKRVVRYLYERFGLEESYPSAMTHHTLGDPE